MKKDKKLSIFAENTKNLAEIFEAPVVFSPGLQMYEINLRYDEFHKKCGLPLVKQRMSQLGFIINGKLIIQITGTGYWDHQNWFEIYRQGLSYALPASPLIQ
uniref:Uncharacterized protein n=1 Tax=Panagrolaimus davidi TaxID=227884 RepID=A0A914Q831_9BILA